jgi:hypothetical protein
MPEDILLATPETISTPELVLVAEMTSYASEILRANPQMQPSSGHFVFKSFGVDYDTLRKDYTKTVSGESMDGRGICKWEKPGTPSLYQYYEIWDACGFSVTWVEGGSLLHENISYGVDRDDVDIDHTSEEEIRKLKKRMEDNMPLPPPIPEVPLEPVRRQGRLQSALGLLSVRKAKK